MKTVVHNLEQSHGRSAEAEAYICTGNSCPYPLTSSSVDLWKFVKMIKDMEEAEEGDFLKVMIWSETLRKEMVLPLDKSFRFDLQFGRRVLGKLLGLQARTHWKDCAQTQAEEQTDAEAFKEAFKAFDFSLE